ncbi:MAG: type I-E CRISPR-associated protein Cse2/CasB [Methylobacter sp.]|nr:type I-E CRISPR-associated protein Cse2/CasB [Methylobacter sp.]MDP2430209.1 type I-E CRISPR-associated protein Cse2/CasB [Methylobacter sp.]MDP3053297.1 type I-E CRISPR-associated protein Cse2/CasB [Methylobacter sp.]MDP3361957.1 type I-E CRISPR-associated protein Cse2/CasB [Methylobacter sp.]MDZ4219092.1 type I-E CRISPR-associated protein Cse2/CasB [Methylobacter sp.]
MSDENKQEKTEKVRYNLLWREHEQQAIREWWDKLNVNLGDRAKLRRCEKPEDVLLQPSFYALQQRFPKTPALALAAVAGLLSHVKLHSEYSFPKQLGQQKEHSGKAVFSELRFQQLLASHDIDELYENLRRAVMQLNRTANVLSLADGVLHWSAEQRDKNQFDERPEQRFKFAWAKAYFSEVLTYSK